MTEPDQIPDPWNLPLTILDGVGAKFSERLGDLIGGHRVRDLLFHKPVRWTNRLAVNSIGDLREGETQTVTGTVQSVSLAPRGSKLQRVRLSDESGFLTLVFFNANSGYLQKLYPIGAEMAVSGLIEDFHGQRQMTHPDYSVKLADLETIPKVEPVYPLQAGLTNRRLCGLMDQALSIVKPVAEWIDSKILEQRKWPGFLDALNLIHRPASLDEDLIQLALERLAYDEALARALAFRIQRAHISSSPSQSLLSSDGLHSKFLSALPYALTNAQTRAMTEIEDDMALREPMQRMLQGDVGSGKTTVAAFACALAAENNSQIAVMAPTEVLARQLHSAISAVLSPMGITTACLTGGSAAAERRMVLDQAQSGELQILCGTHALFQDKVVFHKLGLVIIDEQHRFGVRDRSRLAQKGEAPHLLIMSATPIPRSLAMTVHGDVDLSILDEKPAGRMPVETRTLPDTRLDEVISAVGRAISKGEQAFWVCPRVEDDEDGSAAVTRHAMLDHVYEQPIGLVHGRLSSQAKDEALERFRAGETSVLVATTVIEVGVDVPGATIIVIEGAEKFGLAQLHQLRGRVGRGSKKSFCLLVYTPPLGATAKQRLDTLRKSEDGFYIAEVDFKLRGPGDILGTAQSGLPNFRFIDLSRHQGLLAISQKDVAVRFSDISSIPIAAQFLLKILGPDNDTGPNV